MGQALPAPKPSISQDNLLCLEVFQQIPTAFPRLLYSRRSRLSRSNRSGHREYLERNDIFLVQETVEDHVDVLPGLRFQNQPTSHLFGEYIHARDNSGHRIIPVFVE